MADGTVPWEAYAQAAQAERDRKQAPMRALAQLIQTGGQVGGSFLQKHLQQKRQQEAQAQLAGMFSPVQGPPTPGGTYPKAPPIDPAQMINLGTKAYGGQAGQLMPEIIKMMQTPKRQMEWSPVAGMISNSGNPLEIDKITGEVKEAKVPGGVKSTGFGATMAPLRKSQYTLQDLPSNQGPNTAGGAAYQVKVASRQGMKIIGSFNTPQAVKLGSVDLARAVQRAAAQADVIGATDFGNNLTTAWNLLTQKLTSDPTSKDVPKIRREMYNMFKELDKTAEPWITNQLDSMEEVGLPISKKVRDMQMGLNIPEVPFVEDIDSNKDQSGGWNQDKEARYQELLRKQNVSQ